MLGERGDLLLLSSGMGRALRFGSGVWGAPLAAGSVDGMGVGVMGLPEIMFAHMASTSIVALLVSTRAVFFSVFLFSI